MSTFANVAVVGVMGGVTLADTYVPVTKDGEYRLWKTQPTSGILLEARDLKALTKRPAVNANGEPRGMFRTKFMLSLPFMHTISTEGTSLGFTAQPAVSHRETCTVEFVHDPRSTPDQREEALQTVGHVLTTAMGVDMVRDLASPI